MADNSQNLSGNAKQVAATVCGTTGHDLVLFARTAYHSVDKLIVPAEAEFRCRKCTMTVAEIQKLRWRNPDNKTGGDQ